MEPVFDLLAKNAADLNAGAHSEWIGPASADARTPLSVHAVKLGCYNERREVTFSWRPNCPVASTIDTGDLAARVATAEAELRSSFRHYGAGWFVWPAVLAWTAQRVVWAMTVGGGGVGGSGGGYTKE